LTDSQNPNTKPERKPRRIAIRLTRNLILYYKKPRGDASKHQTDYDSYAHQIYQRTKNEAWLKPIEFVGVVILIFYTAFAGCQSCQMRTANKLTQTIVSTDARAVLWCQANGNFGDPPTYGLTCQNFGKSIADNVAGNLTIMVETFPDQKPLHRHDYPLGGKGHIVLGSGSGPGNWNWQFPVEDFSPSEDLSLVRQMSKIIVIVGDVTYDDGVGNRPTRPVCNVFMNPQFAVGGTEPTWVTCEDLVRARVNFAAHRQKPQYKQ